MVESRPSSDSCAEADIVCGSDDSQTGSILARGKAGDPEALGHLMERCQTRVQRMVRRRMGKGLRSVSESGDIAQEALLEVCRSFPDSCPDDKKRFWWWLSGVVENRLRGLARTNKRRPKPAAMKLEPEFQPGQEFSTGLDKQFEKNALADGLSALSGKYLQVIQLRDFQGHSFREIGAKLSLSPEAAWAQHKRAMTALIMAVHARPKTMESDDGNCGI